MPPALIGLARIERLDLLRLLPTPICVTERVWQEVAGDPTKGGAPTLQRAHAEGLLVVIEAGDPLAFPQLDPGESSVLSAAAAARAAVLIDERKARALIDTGPGLRSAIQGATGIVGVILLARRRGHIAAVRPILDALIGQRF